MSGPEPQEGRADGSAAPRADLQGSAGPRPPLFVVGGTATDEEIAALTVVLQAAPAATADAPQQSRREWSAPHRLLNRLAGRPLRPSPGAWRSSSLP